MPEKVNVERKTVTVARVGYPPEDRSVSIVVVVVAPENDTATEWGLYLKGLIDQSTPAPCRPVGEGL